MAIKVNVLYFCNTTQYVSKIKRELKVNGKNGFLKHLTETFSPNDARFLSSVLHKSVFDYQNLLNKENKLKL